MESSGLLVSSMNLTPVLQIVTWLLQSISVLAVLAKIALNAKIIREATEDDIAIFASLVLSTGQCVAASLQNGNGFGQHLASLDTTKVAAGLKSQYAAQLLWIGSLCLAKLSLAAFIRRFTPRRIDHILVNSTRAFVAAWGLASFLAAAFQCQIPATWDYIGGRCLARRIFWDIFAVINLLSDVALVAVPLGIILRTQTSLKRRIITSLYFSTRTVAIAATVCQLVYWNRIASSTDPTFDQWPVLICTQAVLSASIITACVPQFKPLFDSLESGMLRNDDLRRRGQSGLYGYTGRLGNQSLGGYLMHLRYGGRGKRSLDHNRSEGELSHRSTGGGILMQNELTVISEAQSPVEDVESQYSTSRMIKAPGVG